MGYKLEKITPNDWGRVWRDIKVDPKKFALANKPRIRNYPIDMWAIDKANDSYLFRGPATGLGPWLNRFSFFYNNDLYWLLADSTSHFEQRIFVRFDDAIESSCDFLFNKKLLESVRKAVKQAFLVHRFWGNLNDSGLFEAFFEDEVKNTANKK